MKKPLTAVGGVLCLVALSAFFANSETPTAVAQQGQDMIYACVNNSSGTIKIVSADDVCTGNEISLTWSAGEASGPAVPIEDVFFTQIEQAGLGTAEVSATASYCALNRNYALGNVGGGDFDNLLGCEVVLRDVAAREWTLFARVPDLPSTTVLCQMACIR